MRMRRCTFAVLALLVGCSTRTTSTSSPDAGNAPPIDDTDAGNDPSPDADAGTGADAAVDGGGAIDLAGCLVKRAASSGACAEECDARLTLPGGGVFCSVACEKASDCASPAAPHANLTCPPEVGACVPRCTADASCKAAGFRRCDVAAGGCDTL
jgi:hypothetical protein